MTSGTGSNPQIRSQQVPDIQLHKTTNKREKFTPLITTKSIKVTQHQMTK